MPSANNNNEHNETNTIETIVSSIDDQSLQNSSVSVADNNITEVESSSIVVHDQAQIIDKASTVGGEITIAPKLIETSIHEETKASIGKKRKRNSNFQSSDLSENKAINFPILSIQIGSWKKQAVQHNEELVSKCFFKKKKLAWEVLDGNLKFKFEIFFSDIDAINSVFLPEKDLLNIRLKKRPKFFREINAEPRKHTNWQECTDFTYQHVVSKTRVHRLEFNRGVLKKHYSKIVNSDSELLKLSRKEFPKDDSDLFDDVCLDPYTNNMYSTCTVTDIPSNFGTPQQPLPVQGRLSDGFRAISPLPNASDHNPTNFARHYYPPITPVRDVPHHNNITHYESHRYWAGNYTAPNPPQHTQFPLDQAPSRQFGSSNNYFPEFSSPFSTSADGSLQVWSPNTYSQLPPPQPTVPSNTITNGYHAPSSHHYRQFATSLAPLPSNGHMQFPAQANNGRLSYFPAAPTNVGERRLLPSIRPMEQREYGNNNNHLEIGTIMDDNGANRVNGQL